MRVLFNWLKKLFYNKDDLDNYDPMFVKDMKGRFVSAKNLYDLTKNNDARKAYIFKDAKTGQYFRIYRGEVVPFNYGN